MPQVRCKGLCQDGCASVAMTALERARIRVRHGITLPLAAAFAAVDPDGRCPALTTQGRCSVYESRPWICRAYGATPTLRCLHGCEPDAGLWPDSDALRSLAQVQEIAGMPESARRLRMLAGDAMKPG